MWVTKDSSSADNVDSKIIPLKSISTNVLTVSLLCFKCSSAIVETLN